MTTRSVTILTIVTCLAALALAAFGMGLLDVGEGILVALSIASLTGGSMVALLLLHGHRTRSLSERAGEQVHPGINLSRIPVAGIPGFVFAVGFVWMFWFGAPAFRPLVIGTAAVGGLTGVVLVIAARRRRVPTDTPLGLSGTSDSAHEKGGVVPPP